MKWLLITSDKCCDEMNAVSEFLQEQNQKPFTLNLSLPSMQSFFDVESETSDEIKELFKATHCVIVVSDEEFKNPLMLYFMGYIIGKEIPAFVIGINEIQKKKDVFKHFSCYDSVEGLISSVKNKFPEYIIAENRKIAHKKLFDKGIPFTPDYFSVHVAQNNIETCNLFLEAGMDVNVCDSAGTPMLCVAARSGKKEMIEWLVSKGADIDVVSKDRGYSPVMDAVWKSSLEIVDILIKLGANLNFVSNDGQTALILATGASNPRICELLVRNGADPLFKDRMGMSSLDYAKLFKKELLVSLYQECLK